MEIKDKIESDAKKRNIDLEQRVKELEKLKLFLKDYVVDISVIDEATSAANKGKGNELPESEQGVDNNERIYGGVDED